MCDVMLCDQMDTLVYCDLAMNAHMNQLKVTFHSDEVYVLIPHVEEAAGVALTYCAI